MPYSNQYAQQWGNTLYTSGSTYFPEVYNGSVYPLFTPGLMQVEGDMFMQSLGRTGKFITGGLFDAGGNTVSIQSATSMLTSCVYSSNITGQTLNLVSAFTTAILTGTFVISNNVNTGGNILSSTGDIIVTQNVTASNVTGNIMAFSNTIYVTGNFISDTVTANVVAYQNSLSTFQLSTRDLTGDGRLGSNNATISSRTTFGRAYGAFTLGATTHTVADIAAKNTTLTTISAYSNTYTLNTYIGNFTSNLQTGSNAIFTTGQLVAPSIIGNVSLGSNNVVAQGGIVATVFSGGIIGANTLYSQGGVTAAAAEGNLTAGANNITAGDRITSSLFTGQLISGSNDCSVTNVFAASIAAATFQAGSNNLTMATFTGTMSGTMNCGSNSVTTSTGNVTSYVLYGSLTVDNLQASNVNSSNIIGRIVGSNTVTAATFKASELVGGAQSTANLATGSSIIAPLLQGSLSLFNNNISASDGNIIVGSRLYNGGIQAWTNNFSVRSATASQFEGSLLVYANTISSARIVVGGDITGPLTAGTNTISASGLTASKYTGAFVATNIFAESIFAGLSIGPINNSTGILSTEANVQAADLYGGVTAYNNVIITQNTIVYGSDRTEAGIFLLPDTSNASTIGRSLSHYISNVNSKGGFWSVGPTPKLQMVPIDVAPISRSGWSGCVTLPDGRIIFVPSSSDRLGCFNPKLGFYSELVPLNNNLSLTNILSLIKYDGDTTDLYGLFSTGSVIGPPLQKLKLVVPFNGSPNDTFGGVVPTVTGTISYNTLTPKFTQSAIFNNTVNAGAAASVYATYSLSPSITSLTFSGFTIACWFKILVAPAGGSNTIRQTIFRLGSGTGTAGSVYLYYNRNNSIYGTSLLAGFAAQAAGPFYEVNSTIAALTVGTWYHAAVCVSVATGTAGTIRLYLNGVQSGSTVAYSTLMGSFTPILQIAGQAYNGEIDDFRMYGQEFTASQVLELYQTTTPYVGATPVIYQPGKIGSSLYFSSPPYSIDAFLTFYVPFDGVSIDVIGGKTATITDPLSVISYNTTTTAKFIQSIQMANDVTKVNPYGYIGYSLTSLGITSSGGFTISFWGRISAKHTVSLYGSLFAWTTTDASPMYFDIGEGFGFNGGNSLGLTGQNGSPTPSSNTITISSGIDPTLDFWYHFCLTCSTSKVMTLYVNGTGTSATLLNDFTIANMWLGRSGGSITKPFAGQLDDVRIYKNRVFTQAEVTTLLQTVVKGYESPYYNYATHAMSGSIDIGPSNNASLAFWFKDADNLPPNTRQKCIFSFSNAAAASEKRLITMYYGSNVSGNQYLTTSYYRPAGTTNVLSNLTQTFTRDEWYHLAMTFNAGTAKFFINGVLQTTTTSVANDNFTFRLRPGTNSLNLNYNSNNIDQGESGNQGYDEFRMYSRALSDTEVFDLYTYGSPFLTTDTNKWNGGVLLPNSNVMFVPNSNAYAAIYDPGRNVMSLGQNTTGFNGGVLLPNGNVLCIPSANTFLVEVDPTKPTGTATLNISHGSGGTAPYCFSGCLLPDGNVLCAPASGNAMIYDYRTRTVSNVQGYTAGPDKYAGCCFSPTGDVILAPGSNTIAIGKINQTGVFSSAPVTASNCLTACPMGDGRILFGTSNSVVRVFDPVLNQVSNIQTTGSFSGVAALQDGRTLLVPKDTILAPLFLRGQTPITQVAALSPYLNKL